MFQLRPIGIANNFMKNLTLFLVVTLLVLGILGAFYYFSRKNSDLVMNINKIVASIENKKDYQVEKLDNIQLIERGERAYDNGRGLDGYFINGEIKKITEWVGLSDKILIFDYYFNNSELVFTHEKELDYPYIESIAALDYTNPQLVFEASYYFDGGKLFETNSEGERRFPDTGRNIEESLLMQAKHAMLLLRN